jgi:concanavalin A-like lectin/glucanase superfamily protein
MSPPQTIGTGRTLLGRAADPNLAYTNKVKALSPIVYFPQAEASGTTIVDESGNGRNGTYTGVDLGQTGIGDGRTCPSYDGTNDYGDIYTAGLAGAFNKDEGTLALWLKVSGAGVWTDATSRRALLLQTDTSNRVSILRSSSNNQLVATYTAGGTQKQVLIATSSTAWLHLAITWSKANDQAIVYFNGTQSGSTQTGLGTWSGSLNSATTLLGAISKTPTQVWSGFLAHAAVWTTPLSAGQIATLAVVP